jgi:DNA gyrase subunit A
MAGVIVRQLKAYKKQYAHPRLTQIENAEAIVLEEKKAEAYPAVLLMDRFGYVRTIEESVYEKNREAADAENRFVIHCMSDARLCLFTDSGKQHLLKMEDIPHGKFRDKGTPADNLCNYDSSKESILTVMDLKEIVSSFLIFVTQQGYIKQVAGTEFDVSKRTIASTHLADDDRVISVHPARFQASIVLHTSGNYLLRLSEEDIPVQKKSARGVHGIKLGSGEKVETVFYLEEGSESEVMIGEKKMSLNRLHVSARGSKGSKIRR